MTRDQMIEWLIDNDVDYLTSSGGGLEWIRWVLTTGFPGYENEPDHVLREEILDRDETAFDTEVDE